MKTMHYQRNCDTPLSRKEILAVVPMSLPVCPCGLAVYRSYAGSALFSLNYSPSLQVHNWLFEV